MPTLYLLDTNILVHLVRRDAVGERIRQLYAPLLAEPTPCISVVTNGELRSLGFQLGWGQAKTEQAHYLLSYFPQVLRMVRQYVGKKVYFSGANRCELGLERYVRRVVELLTLAIEPDDTAGEAPLLPILNRYKPFGTTAEVDFKTIRRCQPTQRSHINQVVLDTETWESSAAFRLEASSHVLCYARNDQMGYVIPYEFDGIRHSYEPDFLVRLTDGRILILEVKGMEDSQTRAKHQAALRWVSAVNHCDKLGKWEFHVIRDPQMLTQQLAYIAQS